jgi:hypothetical protein
MQLARPRNACLRSEAKWSLMTRLLGEGHVARLSPLADKHFNVLGRYHFTVNDSILRGDLRPLRDPMPQKNSFGLPALSVRFGSNDSGTPSTVTIHSAPPASPIFPLRTAIPWKLLSAWLA